MVDYVQSLFQALCLDVFDICILTELPVIHYKLLVIIAGVLVGHPMSPELREDGGEWIRICGRLAHTTHCYQCNHNIIFIIVLFPWNGLLQIRKDQRYVYTICIGSGIGGLWGLSPPVFTVTP